MKNTLTAERENLLGLLREYIHSASSNFGSGQNREYSKLLDMPEVIGNICWVRQLECKVIVNISVQKRKECYYMGHSENNASIHISLWFVMMVYNFNSKPHYFVKKVQCI